MTVVVRLLIVLGITCLLPMQAVEDPRPRILIIGDMHAQAIRGAPSWADLVAAGNPQWRVLINTEKNRIVGPSLTTPRMKRGKEVGENQWPGLDDELGPILERYAPLSAVILAVGSMNASADIAELIPSSEFPAIATRTLETLANHEATKDAKILVLTPLPVVTERLDRWSTERFADGQQRSQDLAAAIREAAANNPRIELYDAYQAIWDDAEGGKHGRLLGSSGWIMRGWAHGIFQRWITPVISELELQAANPEAYATWLTEKASQASLDRILNATGAGEVAHGEALPIDGEQTDKHLNLSLPTSLLASHQLDLVLYPAEANTIASVAAGNAAFGQERPRLVIPTAEGEVTVLADPIGSRLIDEALPDSVVDMNHYGINSGKWRPFPVTSSEPGKRRWLLIRFSLPDGLAATDAGTLRLAKNFLPNGTQILENNRPGPGVQGTWGPIAIHPIIGSDAHWSPLRATWAARDHDQGWVGGAAEVSARRAALTEFLTGEIPPAVAAQAQTALDALP